MSLSKLNKIDREIGAIFKSHIDGKKIILSPEKSIQVQKAINSDIVMVLDECPKLTDDKKIFLVTQKDSDVENPNINKTIAKFILIIMPFKWKIIGKNVINNMIAFILDELKRKTLDILISAWNNNLFKINVMIKRYA